MGWRHPSLCVLYSTFIYAFVCTVLLLVYIHFSTLPGRYSKSDPLNSTLERNIEPAIGLSFAVEQNDDTENLTSLVGTDSVEYTNLIPVIDFKDLGHKKRKLLLLIIVSTAPVRFKRRQGIRDTWWKNCHNNRERLLAELPRRPKQDLVWGNFHCEAGITWIDESFMIFTPDIIDKFVSQNESTQLCHPHADQQIGIWLNDIPTRHLVHDSRLYHGTPASFSPQFIKVANVCDSYLGIHGTYVDKMRYFGVNSNDGMKNVSPFPAFSTFCGVRKFDYRVFGPPWRYEPKLCKDSPTWGTSKPFFLGRENKI